ncbi:MAG: hypothetical protein HFI33_05995 [Lachnospiraceae bacterium]|nr:hypothetical protein [Lachnospiraceae bacterium]
MKRKFYFCEIVEFNHVIEAETEELLNDIEDSLRLAIKNDISEKGDLFRTITNMGGQYEFTADGSPNVDYDY